jgi:hypothetical protein
MEQVCSITRKLAGAQAGMLEGPAGSEGSGRPPQIMIKTDALRRKIASLNVEVHFDSRDMF